MYVCMYTYIIYIHVFDRQKIWYSNSLGTSSAISLDLGHPLSTPVAAMQHILAPALGWNGTKKEENYPLAGSTCFNYFKYIQITFELRRCIF